jgi:hypothetical protein
MDFTDALKEKRSHLSANSLKTYNSCLRTIYKNCFPTDKEADPSKFSSEHKKVSEYINSKPFNVRKTILASLVCIAPDVKDYKENMLSDIKEYKEEIDKQEETPTQKENNITHDEIRTVLGELKRQADAIYKRKYINNDDLQKLQDYILVCLLGGFYIVPRRALDYTEMKIRNINKEVDNHIDKNKLVFHKFKTAKFYGKQEIEMPVQLKNILNKYISVIPEQTEYLLFNVNGAKLNSVSLNQRLNKIFNGKISINALRHAYLTDKYASTMKETKKMNEELSEMGSSSAQAKTYVKLN